MQVGGHCDSCYNLQDQDGFVDHLRLVTLPDGHVTMHHFTDTTALGSGKTTTPFVRGFNPAQGSSWSGSTFEIDYYAKQCQNQGRTLKPLPLEIMLSPQPIEGVWGDNMISSGNGFRVLP